MAGWGEAGFTPCDPGGPASPRVVLEARLHTPSPTPPQVCEGAEPGGSQASPRAAGSIGGLGVFFFPGTCSPFSLKVLIA